MGEHPEIVLLVVGLGVDAIKRIDLQSREEMHASLDFKFGPLTLEHNTSSEQMAELLATFDQLNDTCLIFTMPNAATD